MLVTPEFVLVHVPKTGGTFLANLIRRHYPIVHESMHAPYRDLPSAFRDLPAIGFVRDPWEWYVSWFEHMQRTRPAPEDVSPIGYAETMRGDFDGFIRSAFDAPALGGYDLYSDLIRGYLSGCEIGRHENLRWEFIEWLVHHELDTGKIWSDVLAAPPANVGPHEPAEDYYSLDTADLVGRSWVARRFGYRQAVAV